MHTENDFWERRSLRALGSLVLLYFYTRVYWNQGLAAQIVCSLVLLLYLLLIWARPPWWNKTKYTAATLCILALVLFLQAVYGIQNASLLWPLVCILGTLSGPRRRLFDLLAACTILAILLLDYTYPFPFQIFFALAGLFLGLRSRRIRREAYRLSQLHLEELHAAHLELQNAHAELQAAAVHSMRYAALEERTRLAREIHDGLGHHLTSLIVQLQALQIMLPSDPERAKQAVPEMLAVARDAIAEVRLAVREWVDDEKGLGLVALQGLVSQTKARSALQIAFVQASEISDWPIETGIVLYRVLQESLTNILRHSQATAVRVQIEEAEGQVALTVSDNGPYTEEQPLTLGFGLKGMIERCRRSGGNCTIGAEQPHGLRIEAVIPLAQAERETEVQ